MHVCLFDIDGTLIHTGGAGKAALFEALRTGFDIAQPTDQVAIHGRTDRGITRDLFRHHGIADRSEHWERFREEYLRHLPDQMSRRSGAVLPGIVALLERLQSRDDVLLGLLTGNMRAGASLKLKHFELDRYFDFGGFGDEHLDRIDVAREALAAAQNRLQNPVDVDRVWVIGDTPGDVRCGRAIGAKVVAVATGDSTHEQLLATNPDHLAHDFSDVEAVYALWS
ncbi:MAG: HAD family hydrolase [Planctomycetaceae bacterium]|nr:HAD family hydrolase [Planctomycetaceae bacterium]